MLGDCGELRVMGYYEQTKNKQPKLLAMDQWRDLVKYQPWEILKEVLLPLPWLLLELWAAANQHYWLMLLAAGYFFLTCLRVSHNAFHYCLGLSRRLTDAYMLLLSVFMMTSMRATQCTHMQHHRSCLEHDDVEGYIAKLSFWKMLLHAPLFTLKLHKNALALSAKKNSQQNLVIKIEIALNIIWVSAIWLWPEGGVLNQALKLHIVLMLVSHAVSPMFTVWSVHHDCEDELNKKGAVNDNSRSHRSRTLRSNVLNLLAYNMFFHLEHHDYPAVPTCHLPELARRLDRAGLKDYKTVF